MSPCSWGRLGIRRIGARRVEGTLHWVKRWSQLEAYGISCESGATKFFVYCAADHLGASSPLIIYRTQPFLSYTLAPSRCMSTWPGERQAI